VGFKDGLLPPGPNRGVSFYLSEIAFGLLLTLCLLPASGTHSRFAIPDPVLSKTASNQRDVVPAGGADQPVYCLDVVGREKIDVSEVLFLCPKG